eukprot:1794742-Rhodomonas_salina.1
MVSWLLLIIALVLSAAIPHAQNSAAAETERGHAEVSEQLQKEVDMFEAMAQADPKNVSVLYTAGMLYQLAGQHQKVRNSTLRSPATPWPALTQVLAAYMLDPGGVHPELLFHLANNLKAIGENEAAVNFYSLAIGAHPLGPVNWVLISISLDFIGRPLEAVRGYETVLRLGPTARIESWVEIYMLSSLAKVGMWRRALYRYHGLVGALAPPPHHITQQATVLPSPSSGWISDPAHGRVIQLGLASKSLEHAPSFFHVAQRHAAEWRANSAAWNVDQDAAWVTEQIRERQSPSGGCGNARYAFQWGL